MKSFIARIIRNTYTQKNIVYGFGNKNTKR
jgi:hypothetical protein